MIHESQGFRSIRNLKGAGVCRTIDGRQELDSPASACLGEIQTPTLVIVGDQDISSIQTVADRLAADIPGARKVIMHNTAHMPTMEQPEAFNQIVLDFLA